MRLVCTVEVCNRLLPTFNMKQKGRSTNSQISLGRKPGCESGNVFLLICTKQNRNGNSFQVEKNVEQCFTKFVNEGKATIRFIEPPYDVCLSKADPIQLKSFLSVLKMVVQGHSLEKVTLSSLAPVSGKQIEKLKTKLTILKKNDYPITKGFPSSLEFLAVHNCSLKRVDSRMLKLRRLTVLDLSFNSIKQLPESLDCLQHSLSQLIMNNNMIEEIPQSLCRAQVISRLDLSHNNLTFIKPYFCDLINLKELKLDNNQLKCLPLQFGKLVNLKQLSVTNNKLKTLPTSFCNLRLDHLDLFGNDFLKDGPSTVINRLGFPSLLEWSARTIVRKRMPYTEEDVGHLLSYLDSAKYCICGSPCFRSHVHYLTSLNLNKVAASATAVDTSGRMQAPCEAFLCSYQCLTKYQRNPNATIW